MRRYMKEFVARYRYATRFGCSWHSCFDSQSHIICIHLLSFGLCGLLTPDSCDHTRWPLIRWATHMAMVLFTLKQKRCQIYVSKLENQRSLAALQISLPCAACLFLTSWFLLSILMLELVWLECSWYRQPWMQSPS